MQHDSPDLPGGADCGQAARGGIDPKSTLEQSLLRRPGGVQSSVACQMRGERVMVYMVLTQYMGGIQDERVFAARLAAEHHARSLGSAGGPRVVECPVFGTPPDQSMVFVASCYDPRLDIHIVEGAYSTYEEAKSAAGEQGNVSTREIEQ